MNKHKSKNYYYYCYYICISMEPKDNDTQESFLSKVAVESDLRKKTCKNWTCSNRESLFQKKKNCESFHDTRARFLSKVTFNNYFQKKTF